MKINDLFKTLSTTTTIRVFKKDGELLYCGKFYDMDLLENNDLYLSIINSDIYYMSINGLSELYITLDIL